MGWLLLLLLLLLRKLLRASSADALEAAPGAPLQAAAEGTQRSPARDVARSFMRQRLQRTEGEGGNEEGDDPDGPGGAPWSSGACRVFREALAVAGDIGLSLTSPRSVADTILGLLFPRLANDEPLNPASRPGLLDVEVESVAVAVSAGWSRAYEGG